jgi:hypothetical protein
MIYQLSDYLFLCERDSFTGFGGCGTELRVEQARSIDAAAEVAKSEGWYISPPSPFDESRRWLALCSYCASQRQMKIAAWQSKQSAADH